VKSVDDKAALGVAGVKQTATIDAVQATHWISGAGWRGVLADNTWAAMQGGKN